MSALQQVLLAGGGGGAAKWDSNTISAPLALSIGDTRLTLPVGNSGVSKTVRGTVGLASGKWYWEVLITSAIPGAGTTTGIGICDSSFNFATGNLGVGSTGNAGALWLSGNMYFSGAPVGLGITFSPGDTMMLAIDVTVGALWFGKNGTFLGNPGLGTGASKSLAPALTYYPATTPWSSDATNAVVLDIKGIGNTTYTAPAGFSYYSN